MYSVRGVTFPHSPGANLTLLSKESHGKSQDHGRMGPRGTAVPGARQAGHVGAEHTSPPGFPSLVSQRDTNVLMALQPE